MIFPKVNSFLLLLTCCVLSLCGCNSGNEIESNGFEIKRLKVLSSEAHSSVTGPVFNDVNVTQLQTSSEDFLTSCSKVLFNKNYYVLDGSQKTLSVFTPQGLFLARIGKIGRGPGEFQGVSYFQLDNMRNEIIVYSAADMRLFFFDLMGEFLRSIKLDFYGDTFEILNDEQLAFYINYNPSDVTSNFNVVVTDYSGKVQSTMWPYGPKAKASVSFSGFLASFQNNILYNHAFSDTLWLLNSSFQKETAYIFDFEGREWNHGFDFSQLYKHDIAEITYLAKGQVYIDDTWLFKSIMYKQRLRNIILNRKTGDLINEWKQKGDFLFKLIRAPHMKTDEGVYVSSISATFYQALITSYPNEWELFQIDYPGLVDKLRPIQEKGGNPVLLTYSMYQD